MMNDNEVKYFTYKEISKIFSAIKSQKDKCHFWLRDLAIFKVAFWCGLRASEIGLLKLENYNKETGELYCKRLKDSSPENDTAKILNKYIKEYKIKHDDEVLFKSQRKTPIKRAQLHNLTKKYSECAKIKDESKMHFHTLKHSIAVFLSEKGVLLKELQYYLGHKNVNNTQIYFQFTSSQQDVMYERLKN